MRTKVIDLERYQSKHSFTIYKLHRRTNQDMEDVLRLFNKQLKESVSLCDIKACHSLSKMQDSRRPLPVIVKILYLNQKERIFSMKKTLKKENNTLNNQPIFLGEQLTKSDVSLKLTAD